jgi:L-2,4-diaminobutyric acid acetyltransferase
VESSAAPLRDAYQPRPPTRADGARLWSFVDRDGTLDRNSSYAYLLLSEEFAGTSAIADDRAGELAGFVLGFGPPTRPDALFVWQVAVAPSHRGRGLATTLIISILNRDDLDLHYLEATVTPDNKASRRLFQGIAKSLGAPCQVAPHFEEADYPHLAPHEPEELFRIRPFDDATPAATILDATSPARHTDNKE